MRTYYAVQMRGSEHEILHQITVPDFKDPGFYITAVSLEAFIHRDLKHHFGEPPDNPRKNNKGRRSLHYYVKRDLEFNRDREMAMNSAKKLGHMDIFEKCDDLKLPLVKHDSLWDFYKYIGYDYKTNRWSKK